MLISIITICLNDAPALERTLRSVIEQKTEEVEYLVVDGGSTDGTHELLKQYAEGIDHILTDVKGISEAFNAGIQAAKGEWVGIINAGDWYDPNEFDQLTEHLRTGSADVICGYQRFHDAPGTSYTSESKPELLWKEMTVHHQGSFIRRSAYLKYGMYATGYRYAMDYELVYRLWVNGAEFKVIPLVLANMDGGGVSDIHWWRALVELTKAKRSTQSFFKRNYWFLMLSTRMGMRRILSKIGLQIIVDHYRKNYASIRKV